ncbi:hypothetical protein R1flu_011698 [Riccia fluitans]|uniref:Brf1 TBP-binding domain-containing protein n=1 Tax=Riccia fluitans TaxID=41844 RepID=A0ABD1Z8J0_9MARC
MVRCSYCVKDQAAEFNEINGLTCCTGCGRELDDNVYGTDITFTETATGQSQVCICTGNSLFAPLPAVKVGRTAISSETRRSKPVHTSFRRRSPVRGEEARSCQYGLAVGRQYEARLDADGATAQQNFRGGIIHSSPFGGMQQRGAAPPAFWRAELERWRQRKLSDVDEDELVGYIHNEEEVRLKAIIWLRMNKEYLQEQEIKQAAMAATEEARAASLAAAQSGSANSVEVAAKVRKDRTEKRTQEAKRGPAASADEAVQRMLENKNKVRRLTTPS